jgi:mannose-6-phosphate isomerase
MRETMPHRLAAPLTFRPCYQTVVWGGRRLARFRQDVPEGPIGEAWDLADHERGMSVVDRGPCEGMTLSALTAAHGEALVGRGFTGSVFPVLVKIIDAADRLSVQVHPDDTLAARLGVGRTGKTECWLALDDGGHLFQGTRPGIDRAAFERALEGRRVEETLNLYDLRGGDFFFLEARTVHALGAGCFILEIQQTCDVTFRVWDWGRMGLDGRPRALHVAESLETIDFSRGGFGPARPAWGDHPDGGQGRALVDCAHFRVDERRTAEAAVQGGGQDRCTVVTVAEGAGVLATEGGAVALRTLQTALVPAAAGRWTFTPEASEGRAVQARLVLSTPHC